MLLGAKIKCAFVTDLWTALNDLPLVPSGLLFSSVCVCVYWKCAWNLSGGNKMLSWPGNVAVNRDGEKKNQTQGRIWEYHAA